MKENKEEKMQEMKKENKNFPNMVILLNRAFCISGPLFLKLASV